MTEDYLKPLYLAGPISGLTYKEANYDRSSWEAKQEFKSAGWTGLNPLDGYEELEGKGVLNVWFEDDIPDSSPEQAVHSDLRMIDTCDAVFANYSREKGRSLGTSAEIGYAFARNKPIVTLLPEGSANDHPFIVELSWSVHRTWNDAMGSLAMLRHHLEAVPYA